MQSKTSDNKIATFVWVTALMLSSFRGTVLWDILKQGLGIDELPWVEVLVWFALVALGTQILIRERLFAEYIQAWKKNGFLVFFICIALLSLLWTVAFTATVYRTAALLGSSLIGAYLGTRYSLDGILDILFRFGTILLIVCLAIALFIPLFGTMGWWPYNGAWRGVFWHKNQFGSIAALFNLVFLIGALNELPKRTGKFVLYLVFYLFSVVLIYLSKSVAGYLLCIALTGFSLLAFLWLKVRYRLVKIHYYSLLGIGILSLLLFWLNMDFIFGLFNRDTSLTGRLPMWAYLFNHVVPESPWIGHGFGALWSTGIFRIEVQHAVGWEFPVAIADNGFIDILLHTGVIGLIAFLGVLVMLFVRAGRLIQQQPSIVSFFPLLLAIFAVLANITFSLFLETESFLWLVMIAVLFVVTQSSRATKAS